MTAVRHALLTMLSLTLFASLPFSASAEVVAPILQNQPAKIRDNLFLLEEAYNQEPGVIQHIQSFSLQPGTKSWDYNFTEEWPMSTDQHQLSLTIPAANPGQPGRSGVGDFLVNYRLQAIGMGGTGRFAIAPRVSLVLPTGKYQTGAGGGGAGLQFNLPMSIELGDHFVTHLNAGFTATPKAKSQSGYSASALDTNAGAALVWLARTWVNPLIEIVHLTAQEIRDDRTRPRNSNRIINPGIRFAINCRSGLQIVPGFSVPIQFGSGTRGSVLFYLSLEHAVRRQR